DLPAAILAAHRARPGGARVATIDVVEQELARGSFRRELRYQAEAPLPALDRVLRGRAIARDMLQWRERFDYALATHAASWQVRPAPAYERYFDAHGTYRLEPREGGRTRRVVEGELVVMVPVLGRVIERIALAEVHKSYDAEAEALRRLAIL
ncbi:MAG TPA: DUF2505 family protein, partial [Minicystis sp.]|nr:DUF2505 family protein [Minicystis sp.]